MGFGDLVKSAAWQPVRAVANTPWAIDQTVRGAGNTVMWGARVVGTATKNTAAGVAVGVGYPLSIVSGVLGVATGVIGAGSCYTATHLPGIVGMTIAPLTSTAQFLDASVCPVFASTTATLLGISATSYVVARLARRTFN